MRGEEPGIDAAPTNLYARVRPDSAPQLVGGTIFGRRSTTDE
jgi:hypothetical protein